jgi:CDP-diacylglycerol---glycerol-3-phosphate 3-phosphatidyltransferase
MNLPNQLTVARILLTFVMVVFFTFPAIPFGKTMALVIFVIASVTDYWDGYLARRSNTVTAFGRLMDPLADKVLVSAAFVSFVAIQQIVPAWVVITIITREFLVTGLRLLAASNGQILHAGALGKHKTAWQIIVISAIAVGLSVRDDFLPRLLHGDHVGSTIGIYDTWFGYVAYGLSALTALLTVISGLVYLWQNRQIVMSDI